MRARAISRWDAIVGTAAAAAGSIARHIVQARSEIIGLPGAALVAYGLGEIYAPLLPISAGVALLLIAGRAR